MLSGFHRVKQLNSSTELRMSMDNQLKSQNETVPSESPSDVMTVIDRSHMTPQERYEFWQKAKYSRSSHELTKVDSSK
jgi:hypothetical protein